MTDDNERVSFEAERKPSGRDDDEVEGHRFGHDITEGAERVASVRTDDDEPEVEGHRFGHDAARAGRAGGPERAG